MMMWQAIQSNRRRAAMLIVFMAGFFMLLAYGIGFYIQGTEGAWMGLGVGVVIWIVLMLINMAGGESILLSSAGAREIQKADAPQLYNIVEEMNIAAGLPAMPRVFIIDTPVPNAFAVGLNPERAAIAVTTGLLARLNRDEVQGVVAHELGHISNRDTLFMTLAGVTMGAIILLADIFTRMVFFGGGRCRSNSRDNGGQAILMIVALVAAILAPLAAQLLYFACSRRREYLADASAAQFTRYPEALASALEKIASQQNPRAMSTSRAIAPMYIVNPLAAQSGMVGLFSTHPPTEDRIRILRNMAGAFSPHDYNVAFGATHNGRQIIAQQDAEPVGASAPSALSNTRTAPSAGSWREAQEIVHRLDGFTSVKCPCGVTIKLPPDFESATFHCPRCDRPHIRPGM